MSNVDGSTLGVVLRKMENMILQQHYREALKFGSKFTDKPRISSSFEFQFKMSLIQGMLGNDKEADAWSKKTKDNPDCTNVSYGDLCVDEALRFSRKRHNGGQTAEALELINEADKAHVRDPERLNVRNVMARGRVYIGAGNKTEGIRLLCLAVRNMADLERWSENGSKINQAWKMNVNFAYIKAMMRYKGIRRSLYKDGLHESLRLIVQQDPSGIRRKRAIMLYKFGKPYAILDSIIEPAHMRLQQLISR